MICQGTLMGPSEPLPRLKHPTTHAMLDASDNGSNLLGPCSRVGGVGGGGVCFLGLEFT